MFLQGPCWQHCLEEEHLELHMLDMAVKVTITIIQTQTELWDTDWGLSCYLSILVRALSSGQLTLRASTTPEQQRSQFSPCYHYPAIPLPVWRHWAEGFVGAMSYQSCMVMCHFLFPLQWGASPHNQARQHSTNAAQRKGGKHLTPGQDTELITVGPSGAAMEAEFWDSKAHILRRLVSGRLTDFPKVTQLLDGKSQVCLQNPWSSPLWQRLLVACLLPVSSSCHHRTLVLFQCISVSSYTFFSLLQFDFHDSC